ncbi:MAG: hypothetical protein AAFX51_10665 [Cyanobacteria bacterium J06636_28]
MTKQLQVTVAIASLKIETSSMGKNFGADLELIASDYVYSDPVTLAVLQPNVVKPCCQFFSTVKEYNS